MVQDAPGERSRLARLVNRNTHFYFSFFPEINPQQLKLTHADVPCIDEDEALLTGISRKYVNEELRRVNQTGQSSPANKIQLTRNKVFIPRRIQNPIRFRSDHWK
uniref:AlNc14C41G3492 protein n=1 Tax=Albugo laibachii Nc14 TaxID=890382 RepID=F0W9N7_9STRA|nr:AlNc14C41G3492 [Albugo laibachii Nc14]|eukprot:CCA17855.1 AlNc14C41G3492 [Albugo laibachii Nc14]